MYIFSLEGATASPALRPLLPSLWARDENYEAPAHKILLLFFYSFDFVVDPSLVRAGGGGSAPLEKREPNNNVCGALRAALFPSLYATPWKMQTGILFGEEP